MKRNKSLQPLSRQHHNGLLAVLLLRKGIKKQAPAETLFGFVRWLWESELDDHFRQEEEILLPLLQANPSFPAALNATLLQDHSDLRTYVSAIQTGNADPASLPGWVNLLEKHIRFEERVHFPKAEEVLSSAELNAIGGKLHEDKEQHCMQYPVKFWE